MEPWLYVKAINRGSPQPRQTWQALDPRTATWHPVPPVPGRKGRVAGEGSAVLGGRLYVIGGMSSDFEQPLGSVCRYDPRTNGWEEVAPLQTPRGYAATEAVGGSLVVAGGNGARLCELRCAEAWAPVASQSDACICLHAAKRPAHGRPQAARWRQIASLGSDMSRYDSAVVAGRLYMTEGWHWPFHFSPRGFVYDPESDAWCTMPLGMSEGWTGPACGVGGSLCVVAHQEEALHRLEVYDPETDQWRSLAGPPLPPEITPNFTIGAIRDRVYVVGDGLVTAVGHVSHLTNKGGQVSWTLLPKLSQFADRDVDSCCTLEV